MHTFSCSKEKLISGTKAIKGKNSLVEMFLSLSNQILTARSLFILFFSEVLVESKFDRASNQCCSGLFLPHLDDVLTNLGNWSKEREGENRRNLIFSVCKNLFCDLHFEFRQSPDLRSNDSSVMNFKCVQLTR